MRVVFTPRAERQLDEIYAFIADRAGEATADRFVGRIVALCQGLSTFPLRGTPRDDIVPGLRTTGFRRRVLIAFMVTEREIVIEGVFYGGWDFVSALRGR